MAAVILAAPLRTTTTGPRFCGSRLASPSRRRLRAPRRHRPRPAKPLAARKLASGFLTSRPHLRARQVATQSLGTHQENAVFVVTIALGCVVAPDRTGQKGQFLAFEFDPDASTYSKAQRIPTYAQLTKELEKLPDKSVSKLLLSGHGPGAFYAEDSALSAPLLMNGRRPNAIPLIKNDPALQAFNQINRVMQDGGRVDIVGCKLSPDLSKEMSLSSGRDLKFQVISTEHLTFWYLDKVYSGDTLIKMMTVPFRPSLYDPED